jgi:hypothetical protein
MDFYKQTWVHARFTSFHMHHLHVYKTWERVESALCHSNAHATLTTTPKLLHLIYVWEVGTTSIKVCGT